MFLCLYAFKIVVILFALFVKMYLRKNKQKFSYSEVKFNWKKSLVDDSTSFFIRLPIKQLPIRLFWFFSALLLCFVGTPTYSAGERNRQSGAPLSPVAAVVIFLLIFSAQGDTSGDYRKILLELCGGEWATPVSLCAWSQSSPSGSLLHFTNGACRSVLLFVLN